MVNYCIVKEEGLNCEADVWHFYNNKKFALASLSSEKWKKKNEFL